MRIPSLYKLMAALASVATLAIAAPATAQDDYPSRPLKLIVSYPAGGPSDLVGRLLASELRNELGQPVVVENRAGASGLIGLDNLTKSDPDGYTLMVLNNTTTTALHFQNADLNMEERFTPIGSYLGVRMFLVVNPSVIDVNNIDELVEYAKKQKEDLQYTSSGPGSPGHMMMEDFGQKAGLNFSHIPYKGSNPALMDTVAGRVGLMVVEAYSALPHIQSGAIRPIATVSPGRAALLPDLPTSTEQGYPTLVMDSSFGLIAPPKLPEPQVERLSAALETALKSDAFKEHVAQTGNALDYSDSKSYRERLQSDFDRWGEVIKAVGITRQ